MKKGKRLIALGLTLATIGGFTVAHKFGKINFFNIVALKNYVTVSLLREEEPIEGKVTIEAAAAELEPVEVVEFNFERETKRTMNDLIDYRVVVPDTGINLRVEPNTECDVIRTVSPEEELTLVSEYVDGWYAVDYNNQVAYLSRDYSHIEYRQDFPYEYESMAYLISDTTVYADEELTTPISTLPRLESVEIYNEENDSLLIKSENCIGYINKDNTDYLEGVFVIVDISTQTLRLYSDSRCILTTPVVTGKPSTPSDEGFFRIQSKDYERYLKGDGYSSWVDYFFPYNGGEGLHDAEYHYGHVVDGKDHGWRTYNAFGGEIYLSHGSHGCVNMRRDAIISVDEYVEVGTPVLVKK